MAKAFSVEWKGPEVLRLMEDATGEALGDGAEAIAGQVRRNIAAHKLEKAGGFHKTPGAMQKQISAGVAKRKAGMPPAAFVNLGFPFFQIENGTARSKPTPTIRPAVKQKAGAVLDALKPAASQRGLL